MATVSNDADSNNIEIDPHSQSRQENYHLLNSIVVPRPIAWVSSISEEGITNIAPHSYFTIISADPPIVTFVSLKRKDTLRNVISSGEFVVNVASEDLLEVLNTTSADFPSTISEFTYTGLTPVPSIIVKTPRAAEAPVSMECKLIEVREYGMDPSFLIVGEVVYFHISPEVWNAETSRIDPQKLRPIGRLSGSIFSKTHEFTSIVRPTYKKLLEQDGK